jgi:uncharacterized protein HemX
MFQDVTTQAVHLAVPMWNLGTIIALLIEAAAVVRWGTRQEERLRNHIAEEVKSDKRIDERVTILERNGSPAMKSLSQFLGQEQEEVRRILTTIEGNSKEIRLLSDRVTRLEVSFDKEH